MLAAVFLVPQFSSVRELAERAGVPYSVAQREVDRLEEGRLLRSDKRGTSRLVRPNEEHPLYPELRALLVKSYGPQHVAAEMLSTQPGIIDAYLIGSWAARYHGQWGAEWGDVDVVVIADRSDLLPWQLSELEAELETRLGWPVHMSVVDPMVWTDRADPFVRTVRDRPLVHLDLDNGS